MILFHRLTPFAIALVSLAASAVILWRPSLAGWASLIGPLVIGMLCWHLARPGKDSRGWLLVGLPTLFSAIGFFQTLFLEQQASRAAVLIVTIVGTFLFVEHAFRFIYLPAYYQPFAIASLSRVLTVIALFEWSATLFGLRLFLHAPLSVLVILFALVVWVLLASTLSAAQTETRVLWRWTALGTLLLTEGFAALSFLPSSFYTNASLLTLSAYAWMGLSRAEANGVLSLALRRRYALMWLSATALIVITARWV